MASNGLAHSFEQGPSALVLKVALPVQSMEEVQLEVGDTEVRLSLGTAEWQCFPLPKAVANASSPMAKFSRKRQELMISWQLKALAKEVVNGYHSEVKETPKDADEAKQAVAVNGLDHPEVAATDLAAPNKDDAPAFGSIWNKNSWHWEEKNCIDLATAEVKKVLEDDSAWKHVPELSGCSMRFKEVQVKGDASFALRKKKRLLCYELAVTFKWEGRDEFGQVLGLKGAGQVHGITPEEEEEPEVKIEVSTSSSGGSEAKAAGEWMKGAGARRLAQLLQGRTLAPKITAAEVAQAKPDEEIARRRAEERKAEEAANAVSKQHRISEEARQRELQLRAQMRPTAEAVSGSVWNVNAWHWEEKPMTEWSMKWLTRELQGLAIRLLSGLATLEFRDIQVTGDSSVSVRKGKPIVLYLLRLECRWEATATAQGLGDAKGALILPEFSSEDGPKSSLIQVETSSDESRGRLASAVRKEGIPAVRELLLRFEEALRSQLTRDAR